jgi:CRP/FNR family transcriptional regulator, cyclic AMP receptor protein
VVGRGSIVRWIGIGHDGEVDTREETVVTSAAATRTTFMSRLEVADRAALSSLGRHRRFRPRSSLTIEGATTPHVLIIAKGWVKVGIAGDDGREVVVALRGPGDIVGELTALGGPGAARSGTVVALTEVEASAIPSTHFVEFLERHSLASVALVRELIGRLQGVGALLARHDSLPVPSHLARVLLDLGEMAGEATDSGTVVDIGLTQSDLAALVGCSRDSIAKALAAMRSRGCVATVRRGFILRDVAGLRDLAADR